MRSALRALITGLSALTLVIAGSSAAQGYAGQERWTPSPGQAFNDGWKPLPSGATFEPCQVVRWHFDRSGEPAERNTMIDDIRTGLASLEPHTGLTFEEVADPTTANLTFRWGDLAAEGYAGAAGIGGPHGVGSGAVAFDSSVEWTRNRWAGRDWRRIEWERPDLGPGWISYREGPGREALVVHEAMHAMGFDHVEDFTSIMYPQGGIPNNRGELSAGDIAGLNTMYLNQPCTPATDLSSGSSASGASLDTITADSLHLRRTWRKTRVKEATITNGVMEATVNTKFKKGTIVSLTTGNYDESRGTWLETTQVLRVGKKGRVSFSAPVVKDDSIVLATRTGKNLARWIVTNVP